nr:MFS transporter [Streptomyces sp. NBC_00899]WSX80233.1 MFS transporter [Streptomyces sp. NBC_00899]
MAGTTPVHDAMKGRRGTLALLVTTQFMLILDAAIVGVALPSIGRDLGFASQDTSWIPNAYTLLYGGFLILGGRLGDYVGRRRLFTGGLLLFAAASLVGGLAPAPGWLIAARGAQGLAAALVSPSALSLILRVFPDRDRAGADLRNHALAVMGTAAAAGGSVGLFAGGVLTDLWGWEAVFYVNVPVACACAALALRLLPPDRGTSRTTFDLPGAVTVTAGLILFVYVLINGPTTGWTSGRILWLGPLACLLLGAFLAIQLRRSHPLVPMGIFRRRPLRGANLVAALINMVISPMYIVLSLYLQSVLGYSPLRSGVAVLPLAIASTLVSSVAGRLLARFSLRACTATGLVLFTAGVVWLSRISGGPYQREVLGPLLLLGAGGIVFVAFTVAGTAGADDEGSGLASGVLGTSQQIGAAVGLAVITTVATWGSHHAAGGHPVGAADLTTGYRYALLAATGIMLLAVWACLSLLPGRAGAADPGTGRAQGEQPSTPAAEEGPAARIG